MFQKFFVTLLLFYFTAGTLLLPQGDFAALPDLPKMYAHCKATEDSDLDIFDFVEEHLLMLDDLMGETPEPQDKPHQPVQFHHIFAPVTVAVRQQVAIAKEPILTEKTQAPILNEVYLSDYPASVFRPPIL